MRLYRQISSSADGSDDASQRSAASARHCCNHDSPAMLRAAVALKMLTQMSSVATSGPLGPQPASLPTAPTRPLRRRAARWPLAAEPPPERATLRGSLFGRHVGQHRPAEGVHDFFGFV